MKTITYHLLAAVFCIGFLFCTETAAAKPPVIDPAKPAYIILAEQSDPRIIIADVDDDKITWEWKPQTPQIKSEHLKWFKAPSEAKAVYDGKYILMTASGGAVALIRIADKKVMFYAYAGGNTHSAELLPDGNIVSASSHGNFLTVFKTDTVNFPENVYKKNITIENGHNAVWDKKRGLLWSASDNQLLSFKYNNNCTQPDLIQDKVYPLQGKNAHDLFPVYGEDALWLTTTNNVYKVDLKTKSCTQLNTAFQKGIKSVSSGPEGFPIIIQNPKEQWWTNEIIDIKGKSIFSKPGCKIYKARWMLPNAFSYPKKQDIKQCN